MPPCLPDGDEHSRAACSRPHSRSAVGPGLNPGSQLGAQARPCGLWTWTVLPGSRLPPTAAGPPLGLRVSDEGVLTAAGPWAGHSVKEACDHACIVCARPPALGYDHQKLTEKLRSRART